MGKKILIAYFSWGGNAKSIAEKIHSQVGGDMFRIENTQLLKIWVNSQKARKFCQCLSSMVKVILIQISK